MKKRLLSVILCAAMAVSMMAGCGDKTQTTDPTPTTAPTEAPANPTEEPAAPTAEPTEAPAPTEAPVVTGEALPEAKYYFPMEDATGLSARMKTSEGTTMDERVYAVDNELMFTNGVKGNALWLDGNFGAQVDGIEPINTDTYTLSFWVWAARFSTYGTTLQFGNGMAQGTTEHWISFTTPDNGTTYPQLWNRNAALNVWPNPSYEAEKCYGRKSWAHIALVCDETDLIDLGGTMVLNAKLYVNGVPSENEIQIVPGLFTGDKATTDWRFLLGVNPWDAIMKGCIDELYVFDEALTAGQIATLYADGDAKAVPAKSTEPEPEVIRDYSAVNTSGTVIGAQDGSATYGSAYAEIVEVPAGQTVSVKFKNYIPSKLNDAGKNVYDFANTFSIILQNVAEGHSTADNADYKEYAVVSGSEGYEAAAKLSDLNVTRNTFNQFNPEKFTVDSDLSTYNVAITNNGTTAKVAIKANCADKIIRYIDVEEIPVDGALYFTFTTNGSFIDIQDADPVTGELVGSLDCTTPYFTTFTKTKLVPVGETARVHFKNYTLGAANWNNFLVILQNMADIHSNGVDSSAALAGIDVGPVDPNYVEYAVLRADNWGWGTGFANADAQKVCNWNWDTMASEMIDADVVLEIKNNGTTAEVFATITAKSGNVYTQKYTDIQVDGDFYYCLSVDNCCLEIKGTPVGTTDCATPYFTTFSDIKKIEEGTTERVHFTNYTFGAANWNNFLVILQNMDGFHSNGVDSSAALAGIDVGPVDPNYVEYAVLRADNWGWGTGFANADAQKVCNWNWDTMASEMVGADVVLDITNNGTTAEVFATITAKSGNVYTQKYTDIQVSGDLYYCLTVDNNWIDIHGTTVGSSDCLTPYFTTFSDIKPIAVGQTEVVKFRNYTLGAANWNNFLVVLQNMDGFHSNGVDSSAALAGIDVGPVDPNYVEYAVLRADNWGWGTGFANADAQKVCNWVWDTMASEMPGAYCELKITNNGTTAEVFATITTLEGKVYTQKYTDIQVSGDLYYCLTVDNCWLDIFE